MPPIKSFLAGLTMVCLIVGVISAAETKSPAPANTKPKNITNANAQKNAAIPAGMIPAKEAIQRIQAHMETIRQKKSEMEKVFGYNPSVDTMTRAFQQNKVSSKALGYASTWGQGTLYLTWTNTAKPFYDYHLQQLQGSLYEFTMKHKPYAQAADLTYLDSGMQAWQAQEPQLPSLMQQIADIKGQQAAFLGRKMELQEQLRNSPKSRATIEPQTAQMQAQADIRVKSAKVLNDQLVQLGKNSRLFSAINAPERIAVQTPPASKPDKDCEENKANTPIPDVPGIIRRDKAALDVRLRNLAQQKEQHKQGSDQSKILR